MEVGYASFRPLVKSSMHTSIRCLPYRSQQREHKLRTQGPTEKELPRLPRGSINYSFEGGLHIRDEDINALIHELRIVNARLRHLGDECSSLLRYLKKSTIVLKQGDRVIKEKSAKPRKRVHWLNKRWVITRPRKL